MKIDDFALRTLWGGLWETLHLRPVGQLWRVTEMSDRLKNHANVFLVIISGGLSLGFAIGSLPASLERAEVGGVDILILVRNLYRAPLYRSEWIFKEIISILVEKRAK